MMSNNSNRFQLKPGDKVSFLDSVGGGTILGIDEKKGTALVEDDEGFEIPTLLSQLVPAKTKLTDKQITEQQPIPSEQQDKEQHSKVPATHHANGKKKTATEPILEVDLHIAQLVDNYQYMSNAEMIEYQLAVFHKTMEQEYKNRGKKIVFIHGRGAGILRAAIAKQLDTKYRNVCEYHDASFANYGFGATMVIIK